MPANFGIGTLVVLLDRPGFALRKLAGAYLSAGTIISCKLPVVGDKLRHGTLVGDAVEPVGLVAAEAGIGHGADLVLASSAPAEQTFHGVRRGAQRLSTDLVPINISVCSLLNLALYRQRV
jgi:hypothetical protein